MRMLPAISSNGWRDGGPCMPSALMSRATLSETRIRIGKSAGCSKAGNLKPRMNTDEHRSVSICVHRWLVFLVGYFVPEGAGFSAVTDLAAASTLEREKYTGKYFPLAQSSKRSR